MKPITPVKPFNQFFTTKAPTFTPFKPITPVKPFVPFVPKTPVLTTKKPFIPIYTPPQFAPVITPKAPVYTTRATTLPPLQIDIRAPIFDFPLPEFKGEGVPKPIFPPKPELNVLVEPYDKLPQGAAYDTYVNNLFHDFMVKFDRKYIDEPNEMAYRLNVFKENFKKLQEYSKADTFGVQYSVTELSDLTQSEFSRILGYDTSLFSESDVDTYESSSLLNQTQGRSFGGSSDDAEIPEKYDQRKSTSLILFLI